MRRQAVVLVLLACAVVEPATAQRTERTEQQRAEEARRRLQEAHRALGEALAELQRAETEEVRRRLDEVMREVRRAQAELQSQLYSTVIEALPGRISVIAAGGNPLMGVYLDYSTGTAGARIESVVPGGAAEKAGLRSGDVIIKANGEDLTAHRRPANRLVEIKNGMEAGDTLRVEYRRGSETRRANVVLERHEGVTVMPRPAPEVWLRAPRAPDIAVSWFLPARWLNVELVQLDAELGRYFGTEEGLLVVRAPDDETLTLRNGDVILAVDGRKPADQSHLLRILRSYEAGETLRLEIMRDRRRQTLTVKVPEREG